MDGESLSNPYYAEYPPFAGRKAAFARLNQHLTDTGSGDALVFVGRQGIGKTALLKNFDAVFDETYIGVYIPLRDTGLGDEAEWTLGLAQEITAAVHSRNFTLTRLADLPPPGDDSRGWFVERFLPDILAVIRPHRRLILLLDDAEEWFDAVQREWLPADMFAHMQHLLEQFPQLGVVLTLDAAREADLANMSPLVKLDDVVRLTNLNRDECTWLLRQPVGAYYSVPDETITAVYRATGGDPALVRPFAAQLFHRWYVEPDLNVMTVDDAKAVTPAIYTLAAERFRKTWEQLNANERLTLTALGSLLYADPLHQVNVPTIELWLVEAGFPLDATTINAALRGLDYRELATNTPQEGIMLVAGLMQGWLLDNARRGVNVANIPALPTPRPHTQIVRLGVIALVVLVIVALVVIGFLSTQTPSESPVTARPVPTATLASEG